MLAAARDWPYCLAIRCGQPSFYQNTFNCSGPSPILLLVGSCGEGYPELSNLPTQLFLKWQSHSGVSLLYYVPTAALLLSLPRPSTMTLYPRLTSIADITSVKPGVAAEGSVV
jgi:hypothetical protein